MERERARKFGEEKKDLEYELEHTKEDLNMKLQLNEERLMELTAEKAVLEQEKITSMAAIVATERTAESNNSNSTESSAKLQQVLKNTKELLSADRINAAKLNISKSSLESQLQTMKKKIEELTSCNMVLKEELEAVKQKASTEATETAHQFGELEKLLTVTQEALNEEEKQVECLEKQVGDLTSQIQELENFKGDLEVTLESVKQEMLSVNAKKMEFDSLLQSRSQSSTKDNNNNNNHEESETSSTDNEELSSEKIKKEMESLRDDLERAEMENNALRTSLDELRDEKQSMNDSIMKNEEYLTLRNEEYLAELETARSALSAERSNVASTDVRLWESEMLLGNMRRDLKDALEKNKMLTGKVDNLETSIEKSQQTNAQTLKESETHVLINKEMSEKIQYLEKEIKSIRLEKESLLKRTAALARRDQLQKASLSTSNMEISKLMSTMSEFQTRFESLASQVETGQAEKQAQMIEYDDAEAKWVTERHELNERITELQAVCDEILEREEELKSKHTEALTELQADWESERVELNDCIETLEKKEENFVVKKSYTDRSMMNQKVSELEQDIQLLEVTMDGNKQDHAASIDELKEAKAQLLACEEELQTCRNEMQTLRTQNAIESLNFERTLSEVRGEIETLVSSMAATKKDLDSATAEHDETKAKLAASEEEVQLCRNEVVDRETQILKIRGEMEENKRTFEEQKASLEAKALISATALERARQDSMSVIKRETELRSEHDSSLEELKSYQDGLRESLENLKTEKSAELKEAIEKHQQLQVKHDSCLKEMESCWTALSSKEAIIQELRAETIGLKKIQREDQDRVMDEERMSEGRNKQALALLAEELNEAHAREASLEEVLATCREELAASKKKIDAFERKISEGLYGAGVYTDVISKLNKSNDSLESKNQMLQEETEALRTSAASLREEVRTLNARVAAGAKTKNSSGNNNNNNNGNKDLEQENRMMKDLLASSKHSVTEAKHMQEVLTKQIKAATKREARLSKEMVALRARNEEMAQRLEEQEQELDEFESDFALARTDARKVVEELRAQLLQLEKRNKQLLAETDRSSSSRGGGTKNEDLRGKLKMLVQHNKRLQKEIDTARAREQRLEKQLGLEPRR
mmetsp:Transcript_119389/g.244186  ORF Transcript_119389/g.244186 Transcript_119389/m.244186 type:complete len:1119 (-) Transcript_119389:463-3819(-)